MEPRDVRLRSTNSSPAAHARPHTCHRYVLILPDQVVSRKALAAGSTGHTYPNSPAAFVIPLKVSAHWTLAGEWDCHFVLNRQFDARM